MRHSKQVSPRPVVCSLCVRDVPKGVERLSLRFNHVIMHVIMRLRVRLAIVALQTQLLWHIHGLAPTYRATDDTIFVPGVIPLDVDGHQVNAHEGWILQIEDSYLWYGTSHKDNTTDPSTGASDWVSGSINLFVSYDLSSWKRKTPVFNAASITAAANAQENGLKGSGPYRIERPKVLYNAARRYYVLLFHLDTIDTKLAQVGWATSASPYGPFAFQQASQPDSMGSLDLNVATAGDGADAYLVRSVPDGSISISKLDKDYLSTTGICSSLQLQPTAAAVAARPAAAMRRTEDAQQSAGAYATAVAVPRRRLMQATAAKQGTAAPCVFNYGSKWYLLAAERRSWTPSALHLYVNNGTELCGSTWTKVKHATSGPGAETGFDSSPAFVFVYHFPGLNQVLPIYFGDRWNAEGPGSVGNASYVWYPFVEGGGPEGPAALQLVNPGGKWRIGDYRRPSVLAT